MEEAGHRTASVEHPISVDQDIVFKAIYFRVDLLFQYRTLIVLLLAVAIAAIFISPAVPSPATVLPHTMSVVQAMRTVQLLMVTTALLLLAAHAAFARAGRFVDNALLLRAGEPDLFELTCTRLC